MNDDESTPNPAARHAETTAAEDINERVLSQHARLRTEIPSLLAEHEGHRRFGPYSGFTVDRVEADALLAEITAARRAASVTPPTREEVQAHYEAEGGYWLVSRVDVGGHTATDWRPMVLRLRNDTDTRNYLHATIPGVDWGDYWDSDPFALMAGATWTRLSRDGAVMGGAK